MSRATQAELLEQRIIENRSSQQIDLTEWIFERVSMRPGDRVLELCCGTGGQTLALLNRVGEHGRVVAFDISRAALDTLTSKAGSMNNRLTCVEGSLDNFVATLSQARLCDEGFDAIFCAYGLYYSSDAQHTLEEALHLLNSDGKVVIVGPFGPNNKQIFELLRAAGVVISAPVTFSSESFMLQTVLPWGTRNFASLSVHTMVNPVHWTTSERVLNYWQNTTFYDPEKRDGFEKLVQDHFASTPVFVNEKWVMLLEMKHARR